MAGEVSRHSGCAVFPLLSTHTRSYALDSQRFMGSHEVVHGVFRVNLALEVMLRFRMRECLAHQPPIALTRSQVVTFDKGGVDLSARLGLVEQARHFALRAEDQSPTHFHHASTCARFVDLSVQ